jgi:GT2 family glycosyltransferase
MPQLPVISVIVPCAGHAPELALCLQALVGQQTDVPYEIVVVDSAADPDVVAVASLFAEVRVVSSAVRLRAEAARNLGVAESRGDLLAFTDADCVPAPDWLATAYAALQADAKLVGGAVGDALPWHLIAISDNLLQFADFSPFRPNQSAEYFPGCNFALSRAAFDELGIIPEAGALLGADTLFSAAAATRWPGQVQFMSAMRVNHKGRTTLRTMWHHMYSFGYGRARLNIRLKPRFRRWGRSSVMILPVAAKRWLYIARQVMRWHPPGLVRMLLLTPIMAVGLVGWAIGFRDGCREPIHQWQKPELVE